MEFNKMKIGSSMVIHADSLKSKHIPELDKTVTLRTDTDNDGQYWSVQVYREDKLVTDWKFRNEENAYDAYDNVVRERK